MLENLDLDAGCVDRASLSVSLMRDARSAVGCGCAVVTGKVGMRWCGCAVSEAQCEWTPNTCTHTQPLNITVSNIKCALRVKVFTF